MQVGQADAFLLRLVSAQTFEGDSGDELEKELAMVLRRAKLGMGLRLILVHECRDSVGVVEFDTIIRSTPEYLLNAGIYRSIAVQMHGGEYESVCVKQILMALGAQCGDGRSGRSNRDKVVSMRRMMSRKVVRQATAKSWALVRQATAIRSRPKVGLSSRDMASGGADEGGGGQGGVEMSQRKRMSSSA